MFAIFELLGRNMHKVFTISIILLMACTNSTKDNAPLESKQQTKEETNSPKTEKKTILFFGNSITAGYQLDISSAFPALIQERIDSLGLSYQVINAGLSGETSASGVSRIDWVLRTTPDIFVLELGGNDGLRGLPLTETLKNLQTIIDRVKEKNPEADLIIAGMEVPPNLGQDYTEEFRNLFPTLAKNNDAILIPFLLDGVAGIPELNLPDGIHPTEEGHEILTETVWNYIETLVQQTEQDASI